MLMQNKENTNQVNSLCWVFILTVLLLLQSSVWAGKQEDTSNTIENKIVRETPRAKALVTTDQIERKTSEKETARRIYLEKKQKKEQETESIQQEPKAKTVVKKTDKQVPQVSEKQQIQLNDKEKINNDKQIRQITTKKLIQPVDEENQNSDQEPSLIPEKEQVQIVDKENNSKVCQTSPGRTPEMVIIPAGSFMMGSIESASSAYDEKPQHQVTIKYPFAIGRCEVTFADYDLFVIATGVKRPDDDGWGGSDRPVINVSWDDAQDYVRWLSQVTGRRYRLPTEAEWEYAARAGTSTDYYWVDHQDINDFSWYVENSAARRNPVGKKKANKFGLYDMAGNVWEWVEDCWHENYIGAPSNGSAWREENQGDCDNRVLHGGSWLSLYRSVHSANRNYGRSDSGNNDVGFRLAQDLN